jgi:tetratricopeptide (TPR) repeat protein
MARTLTTSRLRRYVGGLAALSVAHPEAVEPQAPARPPLRLVPRSEPTKQTEQRDPEAIARALAEAEWLIGREDWARAQRLLEGVTRRDRDRELLSYLEEVRAVRRALRQLTRRPRDASLRVELGRLYFGLELGEQAAREFRRAIELEPTLAEAHFHLALEHLFQDDEEASRAALARAAALRPDVPSYDTLLNLLWESAED